jgi:hypothetical protein
MLTLDTRNATCRRESYPHCSAFVLFRIRSSAHSVPEVSGFEQIRQIVA